MSYNPNVLLNEAPPVAEMGADVKKVGRSYCVVHSTSGQVLKRKGRRACHRSRGAAQRDANQTRCRVMGVCR